MKKLLLSSLIALSLTSCAYFDGLERDEKRLKEEYGTIQLLLKNTDNAPRCSIYFYTGKQEELVGYDTDSTIYNILYNASFEEIEKFDRFYRPAKSIEYNIPFDDSASITTYESGLGYLLVYPDLSPGLEVYFQIDQTSATALYQAVNEVMA